MSLTKTKIAFYSLLLSGFMTTTPALADDELVLEVPAEEVEVLPADAEIVSVESMPLDVNMSELVAEVRQACEEFAVDEQVAAEQVAEFVEGCVAENMAIDGSDMQAVVDEVDSELSAEDLALDIPSIDAVQDLNASITLAPAVEE